MSSKLQQQKTSLGVFEAQKEIKKKKNQTRIRICYPGSGSADPDPDLHQNETDPKH